VNIKFWTSSSNLLRETRFEGYLTNVEPIRIGAGREPTLGAPVDLAVLRIYYKGVEVPYIPGSSLKGTFRNWATIIARSKGFKVCSGLAGEACEETIKVGGGETTLDRYIENLIRKGESREAMKLFFENACLICKIFGTTRYMSKVSFGDALPIDEKGNVLTFPMGVRTGVAIDRRTGATLPRALYRLEYVEPGARFRFNVSCMNLPNYALGLLASILKRVHEGQIKIGGFKTRGFGCVKVDDLKFSSRDFVTNPSSIMYSLEPDVDVQVELSGVAELKNGWMYARGDKAWSIINKLEEVWNSIAPKS
jgi:CRISPR-associated RAMP protein (TIGR02581 family)